MTGSISPQASHCITSQAVHNESSFIIHLLNNFLRKCNSVRQGLCQKLTCRWEKMRLPGSLLTVQAINLFFELAIIADLHQHTCEMKTELLLFFGYSLPRDVNCSVSQNTDAPCDTLTVNLTELYENSSYSLTQWENKMFRPTTTSGIQQKEKQIADS